MATDRVLVVGQSFGGASTVALAAMNPPGVVAAINFAGGSGGDPQGPAPESLAASLERTFQAYGAQAKVPMLWIYTENDMYFGPQLPRQWHAAFTKAGGKASFVQFPHHGEDGHSLFTRFPQVWQPAVSEFLDANGFPAAIESALPLQPLTFAHLQSRLRRVFGSCCLGALRCSKGGFAVSGPSRLRCRARPGQLPGGAPWYADGGQSRNDRLYAAPCV